MEPVFDSAGAVLANTTVSKMKMSIKSTGFSHLGACLCTRYSTEKS
jgi:hypothetical protein